MPEAAGGGHGLGHLCKGGAGDRYGRPLGRAQYLNLGFELLGKCLDDAGAEPGFCLSKYANRRADPVARN